MSHPVRNVRSRRLDTAQLDPGVPARGKRLFGRAIARAVLTHYLDVASVGRHHLPTDGPAVLLSNHPTYLDPWILSYVTRRWITYMAWAEAFEWPFIGWTMRELGAIPLSTEKPSPSSMKAAYQVLKAGRVLGIFPEGGRTAEDPILDPFMPGAARIAIKAGAPIVPVSIAGARRLWPREQRLPRPGPIRVQFHPRIDPRRLQGSMRAREQRVLDLAAETIRSALPPNGRHRFSPESA